MAYDHGLAERLRELLADQPELAEKRMFGGLAFMVAGHMCCGIIGERLMLRVGPQAYSAVLELPQARPMDFTGKPLTGFVYVEPEGFEADEDLAGWVERALVFVRSLPPK